MSLEARARLLLALRAAGVRDPRTLAAMEAVDRAAYVPGIFAERAWDDTPLPIASGQTISQPSVVARMTEALRIGPGHVVLEVGTGSGYQADVLSRLARRVVTVERIEALARTARARLEGPRRNVTVLTGDGGLGAPRLAPFDRIIMTAAAEDAPGPLLDQLGPGGIMVLPVGQVGAGEVQTLVRIERGAEGFEHTDLGPARFVPLVGGRGA